MSSNGTSGQLAGKVAVVTGAASGFGLATTKIFLTQGAKVVAVDLNKDNLAKALGEASDTLATVVADVTSLRDWEQVLSTAESRFGGADILINNAGTSYPNKPTLQVTEAEFDRVMSVNLKSIYLSVQTFVPHLQKRGGGSIVNIASIGATRPRPGLVWYNASKAAVVNATKGLAAEYGKDNIRVNSICPLLSATGLFETFSGVPYSDENMKKFLGNVPLGRLCDASDVGNACLYLSSPLGSFITGVSLEVDGGRAVG
ncbi:oxidoreductase [Dactylonectria estremocensis]|uniref:Oxidoreductase n=1 Tax=Dactylonectria estremocensis TaxID=1079267 RepID=A0A9P9DT09_9HYPO|nr:oxidoreductase [Dactylonectria estremocensis]